MRYKHGFSLVEVMIVVAILAVLATLAIPNYLAHRVQTQRHACIGNMKAILIAEEGFCMQHNRYTTSIDELCDPSNENRMLKRRPVCPCGGTYTFFPEKDGKPSRVTCTGGDYKEGYAHQLESSGTVVSGQ